MALTCDQWRFPLSLTRSSPLKNMLKTVLLQIDLYIGRLGQDRSTLKVRQMRANQQVKLKLPPPALLCFFSLTSST
jgi:hypothetical protein